MDEAVLQRPKLGFLRDEINQSSAANFALDHDIVVADRAKLNGAENTDSIVRWVSEKVLESYRNGITAGQKGATVIRKGESRRRGSFGKAE